MRSLLLHGLLLTTLWVSAQQTRDVNLEKLIDEIFPVQDENFNYEELYEVYAQWLAHPLNLNSATEEQLQSLMILNNQQLYDFIQYRRENNPLLSLYELQVIPSFTENTIRLLEPFVFVDESSLNQWKGLISRVLKEKNSYFVTRIERTLESKAGFQKETSPTLQYQGKANKLYNRYRVSAPGDFSFGFTAEHDAGEKFRWNPDSRQFGFDFFSAHGQVLNKGKILNLIVGDFQAQFGQGLTLGGGFGMGKGSEPVTAMRRSNLGFLPYTSSAEFGFFRGVSTSIQLNNIISLHGFISSTHRDGRFAEDDSLSSVSSLYLSGFHRTENEIAERRNLREQNFGSVIQFKNRGIDGGILLHQTRFQHPIYRTPTLYNQFSFSGNANSNIGAYINATWRNFTAFSEYTHSLGHGSAGMLGVLASLSHTFDIAVHYRNFSRQFFTFYSNAISETSLPQNEEGIYWGWKYRLNKVHSAQGYIDLFRFPWLKFQTYRPSQGNEWMLRYNLIPAKRTLFFFQIRQESKLRNLNSETITYETASSQKTNIWVNADYPVNSWLSMKSRVQWVGYALGNRNSTGFALIQDLNLSWKKFNLSSRIALFHTDDYDTRIYLYERDAWLAFSIPALQGVGLRRYILLQYSASQKLDFWLRWANTTYENQETIGSQGEAITGSTRNDIKFQIRIKL